MRLEVIERFLVNNDEDYLINVYGSIEKAPSSEYSYRRTFILVEQIERPIEIPKNKTELIIRMWSGEDIIIRDNYDDFCILLNDLEQKMFVNDEIVRQEVSSFMNESDTE